MHDGMQYDPIQGQSQAHEPLKAGAAEPRGPGGQLTPTFSGVCPLFVRICWCMNAADNTCKLSDQWICDRKL